MEHVEGRPLAEFLEEGKPPARLAAQWAAALAIALADAHAAGIVHGYVNPDNVIIDANGTITLRNFSADPAADRLGPGRWPARINYLAPERVLGEPATEAADVFGFGA